MSSFPKTFSELKCEASWKANKFKSRSNLKFVCRNLTNPHTHLVGLKKKIKSETFLKKALTYLLIEIIFLGSMGQFNTKVSLEKFQKFALTSFDLP